MNSVKKFLSLMLAFILVTTMLPMSVLADEVTDTDSSETVCEHTYTTTVTSPTCIYSGYTTYTCTLCGDTYDTNIVPATGHSYTSKEENGYTVYTCHCGDTYSEKIPTLSYNKATKLTSGKSYVLTVYYSRKYYALSHNGSEISARQVTVSNGKITSKVSDNLVWNYSGGKLSYEDDGTTYNLYSGSSVSWAGSGTGKATLTGSTTRSSAISLSSNRLKVGSYYLRYMDGTIKGYKDSGVSYVFQEIAE